jgi:DNA-directed RNA polymerase subunit RPC12/RpoP
MSFADTKTRKQRLRLLNEQRSRRIHKLLERGLIKSEKDVPEHAIPIDLDRSTKALLIIPDPYYEDIEYKCMDCGKPAIWRAETQQYYFEILRKSPYGSAVRCSDCQATHKHSDK